MRSRDRSSACIRDYRPVRDHVQIPTRARDWHAPRPARGLDRRRGSRSSARRRGFSRHDLRCQHDVGRLPPSALTSVSVTDAASDVDDASMRRRQGTPAFEEQRARASAVSPRPPGTSMGRLLVEAGASASLEQSEGSSTFCRRGMRALVRTGLCPLCVGRRAPMAVSPVLDSAGRRRSPATLPGYHSGRVILWRRVSPRDPGRLGDTRKQFQSHRAKRACPASGAPSAVSVSSTVPPSSTTTRHCTPRSERSSLTS
jgi:hypothetical protein